jgi:hypothetical protein
MLCNSATPFVFWFLQLLSRSHLVLLLLLLQVWADVYTLPVPGCDGKTAAEIFEEAGCTTPAAPSCAACLGGPRDTFARMNEPEVRCS